MRRHSALPAVSRSAMPVPGVIALLLLLGMPVVAQFAIARPAWAKGKGGPRQIDMTSELRLLAAGTQFLGIDLSRPMADAARSAEKLSEHWTSRVAGDVLELKLSTGNPDNVLANVPLVRFYYSGDALRAVAVRITTKPVVHTPGWDASARFAGLELTELAGRSSELGTLYETNVPGLVLAIHSGYSVLPYGSVTVLRWFGEGPWDTRPLGEWTAWSALEPAARAAFDAGNFAAARAALAKFEVVTAGRALQLREALCARDPRGEYAGLAAATDTVASWAGRVKLMNTIRNTWQEARRFATHVEKGALARRIPIELETRRTELQRIADMVLPAQYEGVGAFRLVREAAMRKALGQPIDPRMAQDWVARFRPWVSNLDDLVTRRPYWGGKDPYALCPIGAWGATFDNIYVMGRPSAALEVGEIDLSGLVSEPRQRQTRAGAWVDASEAEKTAQAELDAARGRQADIPNRLREIEAELAALDNTAVGRQVQGSDPGVKQYVHVDAAGRTHVTEVSAGVRSVYLKGVREDLQWRNQRRAELKAERERLLVMKGRTVGSGFVVNGRVWRADAGPEVAEDGRMYSGIVRRPFRLKGSDVDVRVEQVMDFYRFVPDRETSPMGWLHRQAEERLEQTDFQEIFGWLPVGACPTELIRLATAQLIERSASAAPDTPPDALAADLEWARALLKVGRAPSPELLEWATWDLPK